MISRDFVVPSSILLHPPVDTSISLGESFFLTCVARGYPLPAVSWRRDGAPIAPGVEFNITEFQMPILNVSTVTSILELCNAQLTHSGIYTCEAQNSLGADPRFTNVATRDFNFSVLSEWTLT